MLITFEGGEGSGKTTIIKEVQKYFNENNIDFILSREPGGCKIAEQIRNVILDKENTEMDSWAEAYLYAAARSQHVNQVIGPNLEQGKVVLLDRYYDSNVVYQGGVRGLGMDNIYELNRYAITYKNRQCIPDLTIYFDLDPKVGLERISKNSSREVNRLDLEKLDFHNKVRECYLAWSRKEQNKNRIVVIDASQSIEEVAKNVIDIIKARI